MSEIVGTISIIRYMRRHLRSWMAPRRRSVSVWYRPAKNRVEPRPLGVVGVVSPWNFPLHLALIPAATALAAGNRVMLKVSEFTPHTSAVLKRLIEENFSPDMFYVTDGGGEVASAFTKLPFDHLIFTGSTQVGKIVAKAAAENLTPVTLELGGKSPVIVDENYSDRVSRRHGGVGEALQRRSGLHVARTTSWCRAGVRRSLRLPRGRQLASSTRGLLEILQYTAILNQRHYDRINGYINEAQALDLEVITAEDPELGRERRQLPLTMIINPPADSTVMKDEIFGPVLPIIGYDSDHTAVNFVNSRSTPLALYLHEQRKAPTAAMADSHRQRQRRGQRPDGRLPAKRPAVRRPRRIGLRRLPRTRRIRRHVTPTPSHVPESHLRTHRWPDALPALRQGLADVLLKLMRRI